MAKNIDLLDAKLDDIDTKLTKNNVRLDGFQNLVVALDETVTSLETKASKKPIY